jgi:hypothetical protein
MNRQTRKGQVDVMTSTKRKELPPINGNTKPPGSNERKTATSSSKLLLQQQQQQQQQMTDAEIKNSCEKVIQAVRQNDHKKIKRYLTRYGNNASKVSRRSHM